MRRRKSITGNGVPQKRADRVLDVLAYACEAAIVVIVALCFWQLLA